MKNKKVIIMLVSILLVVVVLFVGGYVIFKDKFIKYVNPVNLYNKVSDKIKEEKEIKELNSKDVIKNKSYWIMRGENGEFYKRTDKQPLLQKRVNKVVDYMNFVKKKGIDTAFVLVPPAVVKDVTKTPIEDFANYNADIIVSTLQDKGHNVLDTRNVFSDKEKRSQLFLKTDHHWTFKTAFKVAGESVKYMNDELKTGIKNVNYISNLNNYKKTLYKNCYTGAFKRVTSKKVLGVEDIEFIEPKFNTNYNYKAYDKKGALVKSSTGTFVNAFTNRAEVDKTGKAGYAMYMRSEYNECTYENLTANNDKKVLIIGTSHARPYAAFMSLYFKNTHYYSMQNASTPANLYKHIEDINPDVVLVVFSVNSFNKEYMVNFKGTR